VEGAFPMLSLVQSLHVGVPARLPVRLGSLGPIRRSQDAPAHNDDIRALVGDDLLGGGVLLSQTVAWGRGWSSVTRNTATV